MIIAEGGEIVISTNEASGMELDEIRELEAFTGKTVEIDHPLYEGIHNEEDVLDFDEDETKIDVQIWNELDKTEKDLNLAI